MYVQVISEWLTNARSELRVIHDYPGSWTDITWQTDSDIVIGAGHAVADGEVSDQQLFDLQNDPAYVVLWHAETKAPEYTLTEQQRANLSNAVAMAVATDVAKWATLNEFNPIVITDNLRSALARPVWKAGVTVQAGDVVLHEGNLYECIQGHPTQANWPPDEAFSLWKRYYEPSDDPWPWVQPQGAHDAYPVGARVAHAGTTWINTIPANVWEPGVTGWTDENPPPASQEWVSGEQGLQVGARRTYQGATYEVIQNPGVNIWPPPTVPALWRVV